MPERFLLTGCVALAAFAVALPVRAQTATTFKAYVEKIPESDVTFQMVPIPGGSFSMGSPPSEADRGEDEGPQVDVTLKPFWMGAREVTWDEFDIFAFSYDIKGAREAAKKNKPLARTPLDVNADAVTRPTPPYVDMTFGYGHNGNPAICMTAHAALQYCKWLSAKTGKEYRLPTEAEWEYACRAGSRDPYFFGNDKTKLGEFAWYFENSNEKPHPVGLKKPNPFGLYDMHGNVSEWCLDKYVKDYFPRLARSKPVANPLVDTKETRWHAVRGGSYEDDAAMVRAAVRRGAEEDWSIQDPQIPKSIWWHTDAHFVGFRVVRPWEPKEELK